MAAFMGAIVVRFDRFLTCLFCLEGTISCLLLGLLTRVGLNVTGGVVFFVSVTVAAASLGLAILVWISRSGGETQVSGSAIGQT